MYTIQIDHMNLNQIANSGQCFRWKQLDSNSYMIPAFGKELVISQNKDIFNLSCDENEWNTLWKSYFDINTDYNEIETFISESNDKFLKSAYNFGSGIRILKQDLWETIISFIISQNNNIPRIKKSIEKLCDETGGKFPNYSEILNMNLSNKGLGYRDSYLINAAKWFEYHENKLNYELLPYRSLKDTLMQIKGIGNKVADCICLFGLHKLDAFPIDTHIRKIIDREYNGHIPEWVNYKYAGILQQYIFYYDLFINKNV